MSDSATAPPPTRLVLFPGELTDGNIARGHLYVHAGDRLVRTIEACAGPAPGHGHAGRGGHTAEETPTGRYLLGRAERHTTQNWPMSAIPWGAHLRESASGAIEFSPDAGASWLPATGARDAVTRAGLLFEERTRAGQAAERRRSTGLRSLPAPLTDEDRHRIDASYRALFFPEIGRASCRERVCWIV